MHNDYLIELAGSYYRTIYSLPNQGIDIQIGIFNPKLEDFCRRMNIQTWAFLTAYNPGSSLVSLQKNNLANTKLQSTIMSKGYNLIEGIGVPDESDQWKPEPSFFIWNIDLEEASNVAVRFGQKAFVYGCTNILPSIIWIQPD